VQSSPAEKKEKKKDTGTHGAVLTCREKRE
jgi:hypothetical protein